MDMSKVKVGSRVRLRGGGEGRYIEKKWLEFGSSSRYVYKIEDVKGKKRCVWENGRCDSRREDSQDVVEEMGEELKREGDEYLERLNELSTENIVLGRVIEKVLWKVSNGTCADVLGVLCSGCMLVNKEERMKCLRGKLEVIEKVEMREEVSCG